MAKVARNAPCPCGSGKKYKRCCLSQFGKKKGPQDKEKSGFVGTKKHIVSEVDQLDSLSNSVTDLIADGRIEEAESVCQKLLKDYPNQIDGIERLAEVYKAKGDTIRSVEYYRKAANFARSRSGFDKELVEWYLAEAKRLEKDRDGEVKLE